MKGKNISKNVEKIAILTATHALVGIFACWYPESYSYWLHLAFLGFVVGTLASIAE